MEGNARVNKLYNDIREILKMDQSVERGEAIVNLIREIASNYEMALSNTKDVEFLNMANFTGFSAIALLFGAMPEDVDPENIVSYLGQVVAIVTSAVTNKEEEHGSKEEEGE